MQTGAGTASWKYYHVAVTPDAILVSSRSESLREALARRKVIGQESAQIPPAWQTARGQFPATVNGLSFVDFQKVDWVAAKARWTEESGRSGVKTRPGPKTEAGPFANLLKDLDPKIFQSHLHLAASASWKDAQGVHVDGWIE